MLARPGAGHAFSCRDPQLVGSPGVASTAPDQNLGQTPGRGASPNLLAPRPWGVKEGNQIRQVFSQTISSNENAQGHGKDLHGST